MDRPLRELIAFIEGYRFDRHSGVYPFDGLFARVPQSQVEGYIMLDAAAPRVPRRLVWEAAMVSALHILGRRDEVYLARAEALPSLAEEGYITHRVIAHTLRGRARMEHVRTDPSSRREADALMRGAREDLDHAVALVEQHFLPREDLIATLISAGNAWRTPPAADLEEAISRYEHAARLGPTDRNEQARLAKCFADGLIERRKPGDLDRAIVLLEESLKVRKRGPFESETLLSLAKAERDRRADRTMHDCEHVHRILLAAQRKDRLGNGDAIAQMRVEVLAAWLQLHPGASDPLRALDDIAATQPSLGAAVAFAKVGGVATPKSFWASFVRLLHPALRACVDVLVLVDDQLPMARVASSGMLRGLTPGMLDELEKLIRNESIANDPERLAAKVIELGDAPKDEETPGRLVARARILARLSLFRRAARTAVAEAAREAEVAIAMVEDPIVCGSLLLHLASVWGPVDLAHPVQDFVEAARLCERAVAAAEGDAHVHIDALLHLARATQHRTDGDLRAHLDHAEAIYEDIIRRAPGLGAAPTLASARQNLAALATARGAGVQDDRREAASVHQGATADLGNVMGDVNRAWDLTQMAARRGPIAGAEFLRQALALYERVPLAQLSENERINTQHLRAVAESLALEFEGRHMEAVHCWRERLDNPDVKCRPDLLARTRHNLGDLLVRYPATVDEGLRALESALECRTLERTPREHWETNLSIVMGLGPMLARELPWAVRMSSRDAHRRAVSAARGAVLAGRRLGLGEELALAGQHLCQLALLSEQNAEFEAQMEEGWRAMSDALPCMIEDEKAALAESRLAEAAALRMFRGRCQRDVVGLLNERIEVLHGESATAVYTWAERAMLPQQRRLAARFARPLWCNDEGWRAWNALLDTRDPLAIARWVERARVEHPDFLNSDGDTKTTIEWLASSPARGTIALLPTREGVLAVVETATGVHAVLLPPPPSAVPPEELPRLLAELPDSPEAARQVEGAASQAHETLIKPLCALVGTPLEHVRIAIGARLRWLPPSALLPGATVHVSPSIRFPKQTTIGASSTMRVALLGADPEENLGHGIAELGRLSQELASSARVTTALGKGPRWGRALGVPAEGLVDHPPSPETFFKMADGADVLVLLAHGHVIDADGPAIAFMNERGDVTRLVARGIAARASLLAGRHLVLLSCEAGFVDAAPHRLGLLLGELLACGPASVTAASWAVPLDSALSVARFVIHALLRGREPEEGLKQAIDQQLSGNAGSGPLLGRRLDPVDRKAMQVAAARAWITWRP
jgi:hypothetical protein